jgi:hypothetical protein
MMKRAFAAGVAAVLAVTAFSFAADLTVVNDGKSDYRICVGLIDEPAEALAAEELAKYVKAMSGVELKVERVAWVDALPRRAICVSLLKGLPPGGGGGGGRAATADWYSVGVHGDSVRVTGGSPVGLLLGVYQLLGQNGCRFLAPGLSHYGGSAEIVPRTGTIKFSDAGSAARLPYRKLYVEEGHSHTAESLVQMAEWMAKVGYNVLVVPADYQGRGRVRWDNWRKDVAPALQKRGITIEVGGHGYQNFLNAEMEGGTLFEKHPEWFGADASGKRQRAKAWVFCTSNGAARRYVIGQFVAYVKERPEIQIYDFWPPDGAKWCECAECAKLGTPSDRQALLANEVRAAAKGVRPDLRLEVLAYERSITPPEHAALDREILLDFCPIGQHFDVPIYDEADGQNAAYVAGLKAWREKFKGDISVYSYYRKYAWDSLPVVIPHYMQRDLQGYAKVPVQGVSTYAEPGDWFTYELNHYVLAKLAWDPDVDVDAVVKAFGEARYGAYAEQGLGALRALEASVREYGSVPYSTLKDAERIRGAVERVAGAQRAVREAADGAVDAGVKHNLRRLAVVCEYARRDLEIQHLRAVNGDREQMRKLALDLHGFIVAHSKEGVFLLRGTLFSANRMLDHYGLRDRPARGFGATRPVGAD